MGRVIKEERLADIVTTTASYIQAFWNALDQYRLKEAGFPVPGVSDFFSAFDKTFEADKWTLTNDWMMTFTEYWRPPQVSSIRLPKQFLIDWPTPAQWANAFLRRESDPFKIFLNQLPDRRVQRTCGGVKFRKRIKTLETP